MIDWNDMLMMMPEYFSTIMVHDILERFIFYKIEVESKKQFSVQFWLNWLIVGISTNFYDV